MLKIINKKIYDTLTAHEIKYFNNGLPYSDFNYYEETLYKKHSTGEFFLAGEGGAMTKYAKHNPDRTSSYGSNIIPLTYNEAQKWCEDHLSPDEYIKLFNPKE